jgi:chromosomal replication initiation ATPase DnaA
MKDYELILVKFCKAYQIKKEVIKSKSQKDEICRARNAMIYAFKILYPNILTMQGLGKLFNRHHSTILHSLDIVNDVLDTKYRNDDIYEYYTFWINHFIEIVKKPDISVEQLFLEFFK